MNPNAPTTCESSAPAPAGEADPARRGYVAALALLLSRSGDSGPEDAAAPEEEESEPCLTSATF